MRWRRTRDDDLTCRDLVELVTAYLDGALAPADRARVEAHLDGCPDCRAYVAQFARTVIALGAPPAEDVDEAVLTTLVERFRDARGGW
jgi:anti-sigma factor RsiW